MRKTTIAWLPFLILTTTSLFGQSDRLQVVVVSGDVRVLNSNVQVHPLHFLKRSETVSISTGGYLLLIDFAANIYEFRGETSVFLDTLRGRSLRSTTSVDIDMLYSDQRTISPVIDDSKCVLIESPFYFSSELVMHDSVTISWLDFIESSKRFVVVVENEFGDRILTEETRSHQFSFALDSLNLSAKNLFIQVHPYPKNKYCNSAYRKIVLRRSTTNGVHMLDRTAGSSVIKGLFFEQLNMLDAAELHYEEALRLAPDVGDYALILSRFRSRRR